MCMTSTSPTATTPPIAPPPPPPPPAVPPATSCASPGTHPGQTFEELASAINRLMANCIPGGVRMGTGIAATTLPAPVGANAAPIAAASTTGAGTVDPSTVRDKASTGGLSAAARRGLEEAHRFGLPLVSGRRSGGGGSDHDHGNAIDVGTLPIGSPSSSRGTPQMQAFAEHMRLQGKAGNLDVKYVIHNGMIASPRDGWQWRPYTYPGKTAASLESLRRSNPGEFNRLQHYDHVHVSFG